MSNDLEEQLRGALRSVDPGKEFAQSVMSRIESEPRARPSRPPGFQWLSAATLVAVVLGVFITHEWHARREQQGFEAREQLIEALRVTGEKLDLAYRVVNDEAHSPTGKNSGA
jgi:AcrR family transcriptional regulator